MPASGSTDSIPPALKAREDEVRERLQSSSFRTRFKLGAAERAQVETKGLETIRSHARDFVSKRLAPANPSNDGHQTPWKGHPVFVAQHATATCCRKCLANWHHIPRWRELTTGEIDYVVEFIMRWIQERMV